MASNWLKSFLSKILLQCKASNKKQYPNKKLPLKRRIILRFDRRSFYCGDISKKLKFSSVSSFIMLPSNYHIWYYNSAIWEKDNILNSKCNWFRGITYRLNYFQLENLVSTEKLRPGAERAAVIITKVQNFFPIFLPLSPTFSTCSSVPFYLTPLCPRGMLQAGWKIINSKQYGGHRSNTTRTCFQL